MRHSLGEKVSLVLSPIPSTILVAKDLKLKGFVQDYLPLHIESVLPDRPLSFDLFIFFKETYLCYTPKGQPLSTDKLNKLRTQTVARFFVNKSDVDNVYLTLDLSLKEVVMSKEFQADEKVTFTQGAAKTAFENFQLEETEQNFKLTKKAANSLRQVIQQNPMALKKLFGHKSREADRIIQHSLNVCGLCTKLGERFKLKEDELEDLATAALIHDVGLTRLTKEERNLFIKDPTKFTPDDKRIYNTHCRESTLLMHDKPYINKRVQDLVMNHEENNQGTGPNKVKKLDKLTEILSIVNTYDKKIICENITPMEAFKKFTIDEVGNYTLEVINKFKEVLKSEGLLD
ncbi:MAG: hypothetical protein COW00_04895 [Bdellovibrio sp. CG12_big_fil_rev_8_21_14_0_65_39_13]|nr:MAG: hypothetical protein COW78_13095 [Bdellovibrio sp. CG22_combo_CG10-13_8_21_14_all_39_27]PIQ61146.1 MAG: hypothetical protein COW00_04895 [Bdellovibrio sp. CG12_big_fil_rev_8_21_14_0_65_39_13]PIR34818.1 MAG: hypothetical protein COV37_11165 [Bdellovibrio sp. CG11_big_fil_rev_8_21_14_0_20_39_38]